MKKNVAGQKIGAEMITAADGSAFTGTVTVYITGDAGTQAIGSVGSGICPHEGNGYHTYAPSQGETNYDLAAFTFIGTGAIPVTLQAFNTFPQAGDSFSRIGAAGIGLTAVSLAATGLDAISQAATGMIEIAKAVWDRELKGSTHNIPTSAGRRLRQATGIVFDDGTAQAGGVNNITLKAGADSTDGLYFQTYIAIVGGTGAGQGHHIVAYDGTTKIATVDDDWIVQPDATSEYVLFGSGSHEAIEEGTPTAVASGSITLNDYSPSVDDQLNELNISIVSGTGNRQVRRITAYNGTTKVATIDRDWDVNPTTGSAYWIHTTRSFNDIKGDGFVGQTLEEIFALTATRLASTPFATEHSPASYNVTDGVELSGGLADIATINQTYLKVQETGKYKIDTTYTGVDEEHDRFFVRYRYFGSGSSNHKVEMKMWNYQTSVWDDVLATDKDLPATDVDSTIVFDVPGTVADYYDGSAPNLTAQLRIEHESNFNSDHQFWLDAIGLGDLEEVYTAPDNVSILAIYQAILDANVELPSIPTTISSTQEMIQFIFQYFRNRRTVTASTETMYQEDGTTELGTAALSDDQTTFDKGEAG